MPQRILVTGGDGLLANALRGLSSAENDMLFVSRVDFDLTAVDQMQLKLEAFRPEVVINTAAYNLVERCAQERDLSWEINALGPGMLAKLCTAKGIRLIHYSTDYVFDGPEKSSAYAEADAPNPVNHYGAGKLGGEMAVLAASPEHVVMRTSWVFGSHPTQTKSYVHSVLRAARTGSDLQATTDQISVPTYSEDLARWTLALIRHRGRGVFHAVNDEGLSRFDWTRVILEEAKQLTMVPAAVSVEPVTSDFFKSTVKRPHTSILANSKLTELLRHPLGSWRAGLRKMLAREAHR